MAFQVTVHPGLQAFAVEPGEKILDAGLRQGIRMPYGCRDGKCGSCKGRVLEGRASHGAERPPGLSAQDEAQGYVLFCQAMPLENLLIEVREVVGAPDLAIRTLPSRIASLLYLAPDVIEIRLQLPATERLQFLAGQFLDVQLRGGDRRSYSMANAPQDDAHLVLHVRKVPGGRFSEMLFGDLKENSLLRIRGPLGTFLLDEESSRPRIFVAGGTGFAPIKSMLDHLLEKRLDRPHHLFWGARDASGIYLPDWARGFADRAGEHFRFTPVLSESAEPEAAGFPAQTGWVHEAVCATYPDLSGFDVYMAGPPPMIRAAREHFSAAGLPEDRLFYDSFEPAVKVEPEPADRK